MDKKTKENIIKAISVVMVIAFLLNMVPSNHNLPKNVQNSTESGNYNAAGEVNFTVLSYNPYFYLGLDTNSSIITQLQKNKKVEYIEKKNDRYIVALKDGKDLPEIYSFLQENNITISATAAIYTKGNEKIPEMRLEYSLEPNLNIGDNFQAYVEVEVRNNQPYKLYRLQRIIDYTGTVEALLSEETKYNIPWEDRNIDLTNISYLSYDLKDSVGITPELSPAELNKEYPEYITYISTNSIKVETNMTDKEELENLFPGHVLVFPDSELLTNESLDLDYNYTKLYVYLVKINGQEINITTDKELEIGEEVELS